MKNAWVMPNQDDQEEEEEEEGRNVVRMSETLSVCFVCYCCKRLL